MLRGFVKKIGNFEKFLLLFVLNCAIIIKLSMRHAPLAQLDRASGYGPEGRGFESLTAYHREPIDFNGFAVFILSQDKLHTPFF